MVWNSTKQVKLNQNPWLCDCKISWLVTSGIGLDEYLKCASPKQQAKKSIAEVRASMAEKWGFDYDLWSSVEAGDEQAKKYFDTWNNKVINSIPKDRLLIYNVKDGWEPLAKFLNITSPAGIPFPRHGGQFYLKF